MVRMAPRLTFGPEPADWQERIDVPRMRKERAERARKIMRKYGIPALLAARGDNCRYLTGLVGPEFMPQLWYVLFFVEDDPVIFAHAGWPSQMADEAPWIKHWKMARAWLGGVCGPEALREETNIFATDIVAELKKRGLAGEKLGIIGFDGIAREALSQKGISVVDFSPYMMEARATKTKDEINCLKMTAAICEAAWYKVWQSVRVGLRDQQLSHIATQALYEAGANEAPIMGVFSGPLTFERGHRGTGRFLQNGDLIYIPMCGVTFLGYRSCTYRTLIAGRKPNDREKDWYKRLVNRIDAVIDAVKPGGTTADAAKHLAPASTWGYHDEVEVLTIEIGHGIGLAQYELPVINRQWSLQHPQVFEPGMTFALECREGEFRVGGVRLENMLVVTENGAEVLDYMPRDEIWAPPD